MDGQPLVAAQRLYLALNKPRGLVTSVRDEQGRDTVYRCFEGAGMPWLAPVGRLDKASEGLLFFSNDPEWAARLTDPATGPLKTYRVQIDGVPDAAQLARMPLEGMTFDPLAPGAISVVSFYNPQRSSATNIVPGLVGVILTMTMVLFTAVAIVRERERGNMELLIATPLTSAELMVGKVVPYVAVGLLQTGMVLALGAWFFHVPMAGSLWHVFIAASLLIVANLALGLLISTRAQSQFQAMQMTFFLFLPSILLSGFMFPFSGMPRSVQWLAELLPLTHFLRLIRGMMLRGASLWELWPDALALLVFSAVMMAGAILRFRKRLD